VKRQISQAVKEALKSSRKVKITFKRTTAAIRDIKWLLRMQICDTVSLVHSQRQTLVNTANSGKWDRDCSVVVTLTTKFDQEWFIERMHGILEKIQVIGK